MDRREAKCKELGVEISAWLDGELKPRRRRVIAGHLEGCPACQQRLEWLRSSRQAVRAASPEAAPSGFDHRLAVRLRGAPMTSEASSRWLVPALRLAACLLAATALFLLWASRRDVAPRVGALSPDAAASPIAGREVAPPEAPADEPSAGRIEPLAPPDHKTDRPKPAGPETTPESTMPIEPPAQLRGGTRPGSSAVAGLPRTSVGLSLPNVEAFGRQQLGTFPPWLACNLAGAFCRFRKACESPIECGSLPLEPVPLG